MTMQNNLNTGGTRETVVGVFRSQSEAQQAVRELRAAGFGEDQIGIASQHTEGSHLVAGDDAEGSKAGTGAVAGATAGLGAGRSGAWELSLGYCPPSGQ